MRTWRTWSTWSTVWTCCLVVSAVCASAERAHAQIKPYFLVVVDTSGSMKWCAPGETDCSCHVGNNCGNAFNTNICGFPANKIGDAKCALQRIIDGTGDAEFGLMQFAHTCQDACLTNDSGNTCDAQLLVPIQTSNTSLLREWVDGTCVQPAGATCASAGFLHELSAGGSTPLAQSLHRANEYLRGNEAVDSMGRWMGYDVKAMAALATPVYVTNTSSARPPVSPLKNDAQLACRPVSVILLTDGVDTCAVDGTNDPPAAAAVLNTGNVKSASLANKAFRTYVIGFGKAGDYDPAVLSSIAASGGTDARPGATNGHFFPAANEPDLSLALNQIIADSQAPVEVCNGADDDCDGKIDEGITKYCNKPAGHPKADLCTDPGETKCDGKDDNCDGKIDNGFANVCSTCTSSDKEVCDGVDNNCNGKIDEGTSTLAPCGSSKGECQPGQLMCIAGSESCEGGVGPAKEICDCKDNDCDGTVDEEASGDLCGKNMRCAGCKCVAFCDQAAEFTASCKDKKLTPEFQPNGECLCVNSGCDAQFCGQNTSVKRDGKVACGPNSSRYASCQCRAGGCAPRCDGVTCASGEVCDPRSGLCAEDNCRGLGCDAGNLCDPSTGACTLDPCANSTCTKDEVCRGGTCEKSCAGVNCAVGQTCAAGKCRVDKCATVACSADQACDPETGTCVTNSCLTMTCKIGQLCDVSTAACIADPCWNVTCPATQLCARGQCEFGGSNPITSDPKNDASRNRLLATGGGGCACSVPGAESTGLPPSAAGVILVVLGMLLRSRRRRGQLARSAPGLAVLLPCGLVTLMATLVGGCQVKPFCVDCVKETKPAATAGDGSVVLPDGRVIDPNGDGGMNTVGGDGGAADVDAAGSLPQCVPGVEICNGKDDDCDFKVDEETSAKINDCPQAGICAHTKPVCVNGAFVCRFPMAYEPDEVTCDGIDNDCDGEVDETFPKVGTTCQIGVGECRVNGMQECNAAGTGLTCLAGALKKPSPELCDGKDNDCDGLVDEPQSKPGSNPSFVDQTSVGLEICDGIDNDCDGLIDEPKSAPGFNPSYVHDDVVQVNGSLWVYKFEASRVDATVSDPGASTQRSCSRANVMPWTNVTYMEAVDACTAAGMDVCDVADWITACKGGSGCGWSYTPASGTCNDYQNAPGNSTGCNGHDITKQPGAADTDALLPTGSKPLCYAHFSGGNIFDLSGNAKEWTTDPASGGSPMKNPLRGGSYDNAPTGLRCDFDFGVGGPTVRLPSVGFRCCSPTAP